MNKLLPLLLITLCCSCTESSEVEKYQDERDNIVNVKDKIKEIVIDDVLIGRSTDLHFMGDYFLIQDRQSYDGIVHVFDKKTFKYLASTGSKGQGPTEIASTGYLGVIEAHNKFYITDNGKLKILTFDLDSVLADPFYEPHVKMKINPRQFPSEYTYINDTLCFGKMITPIGHNDFKPSVGKWNMKTGEIELMKYEHPEIKTKRTRIHISIEHNIYVECHERHDLMTICSLDGNLKHNIYGPEWSNETRRVSDYSKPIVCRDKILTLYSGRNAFDKDENGQLKSYYPTKILVFELNGDYIKTLETEYDVPSFYYDEDNHGLILKLDEEIQFAYLDLNGLVD
jgi:hypothetical protein